MTNQALIHSQLERAFKPAGRLPKLLLTAKGLDDIAVELGISSRACSVASWRTYRRFGCKTRIEYMAMHIERQGREIPA